MQCSAVRSWALAAMMMQSSSLLDFRVPSAKLVLCSWAADLTGVPPLWAGYSRSLEIMLSAVQHHGSLVPDSGLLKERSPLARRDPGMISKIFSLAGYYFLGQDRV